MKKQTLLTFGTLSMLLITPLALADGGHKKGQKYKAELIALNSSGVKAELKFKLKGNRLKVKIEASGLEPGKVHPQHIHGHASNINADCPVLSADMDGDNLVSVTEGLPNYGPIVLPLTPFNLVDEEGNLEFRTTVEIDAEMLHPLQNRAVVMHGMTVKGEYIPSLPVACGQIRVDD